MHRGSLSSCYLESTHWLRIILLLLSAHWLKFIICLLNSLVEFRSLIFQLNRVNSLVEISFFIPSSAHWLIATLFFVLIALNSLVVDDVSTFISSLVDVSYVF